LTAQDDSVLTKQQHLEEEEQRRAKKEEENSCKPSKKKRFLGNQHTKSTPKPKDKPPPAAATLKKRCCPVEQDSSEKILDNVSKMLDTGMELEGVVGLLVGEAEAAFDNNTEESKRRVKMERYSKLAASILRAEEFLETVIQSSKDKRHFAVGFVDTLLAEGICKSVHQAVALASIAMRKAARKGHIHWNPRKTSERDSDALFNLPG
jgi:hypothetical protein